MEWVRRQQKRGEMVSMMKRSSGILMPVSSLPSRYGIGCFSREAREFVDFLARSGQTWWQVLPFGPTGFGDSPYQAFSAFAGNPYFVCLETLCDEGLLSREEVNRLDWGGDVHKVDYGKIFENRPKVLRQAAENFFARAEGREKAAYEQFLEEQKDWLPDYALFMTLKELSGGKSWLDWEPAWKKRDPAALADVTREHEAELRVFYFTQYEFQKQLDALRACAKEKNVRLIGDLPYYVALDSADVWAHTEYFEFDENDNPTAVAGCPPDAFSPTGQRWGNPIYNWQAMQKDGYHWWIRRLERNYEFCDVIRIDHFNGFESYYEIPYEDETAEHGTRKKGPGAAFFAAAADVILPRLEEKETSPEGAGSKDADSTENFTGRDGHRTLPIIAEDLGEVTPATQALLEETGFPGMNVLEYAFDWTEYSYYMTHNHVRNSVVYTGTHDNKPVRQWIEECSDHDRDLARRYIHSENTDYGTFTWDLIREAYRSVANLCIVPLYDYLVKGKEARINTPGTMGGNWQWRLEPHFLSEDLAKSIYGLAKLYCRLGQ